MIYAFANGALLKMGLGALDQALGTDAALTNWAASGVVHPDAGAPKGEAVSLPPWVHCPNAKGCLPRGIVRGDSVGGGACCQRPARFATQAD